jgi:rfaE bifunctional protein nucleotidyltransferase chain/domain
MNKKIRSQEELIRVVADFKRRGKVVTTTNGIFDVFNIGHLETLQTAKTYGDILIVLINSDDSTKMYRGVRHPIIPQQDRASIVAALDCVDYVCVFDDINPCEILNKLKPNIHVKGGNWKFKFCPEIKTVEMNGGKFAYTGYEFATDDIIKKIFNAYEKRL